MAFTNDYIKIIEYLTFYPNGEGSKTLIATALTTQGYRVLMYAPAVENLEMSMNSTQNYEDCCDARNIPIVRLPGIRTLKLEGVSYLMKNAHNENDNWFLKIVYLDGPQSKNHVKKADLEKLLGCVIDG